MVNATEFIQGEKTITRRLIIQSANDFIRFVFVAVSFCFAIFFCAIFVMFLFMPFDIYRLKRQSVVNTNVKLLFQMFDFFFPVEWLQVSSVTTVMARQKKRLFSFSIISFSRDFSDIFLRRRFYDVKLLTVDVNEPFSERQRKMFS